MEATLWSIVGIVAAAAVIGLWRAMGAGLHYAARATADRVVDRMGDTLEARWEASIVNHLRPIEKALDAIDAELTLNGGDTVKDGVWELRQSVSDLQHQVEAVLTDR